MNQLKVTNNKLRNKIKELNNLIEIAIDKANVKKLALHKNDNIYAEKDLERKLAVKEKELENSQKQIKLNDIELVKLQSKFDQLVSAQTNRKLEETLRQVLNEKNTLKQQLKELETENYEQNRSLDQAVNTEGYQRKIKYLMEDLRMWRDKNYKLETQLANTEEARFKQEQKMQELESQNQKIKSRLDKLKASSPSNRDLVSSTPPDNQHVNLKPEIDAMHKEMQADSLKQKKEL